MSRREKWLKEGGGSDSSIVSEAVTPLDDEVLDYRADIKGPSKAMQVIEECQRNEQTSLNLQKLDIQDVKFMSNVVWVSLTEINLSRNMVTNIDILSQFVNLRVIDAQNNYL